VSEWLKTATIESVLFPAVQRTGAAHVTSLKVFLYPYVLHYLNPITKKLGTSLKTVLGKQYKYTHTHIYTAALQSKYSYFLVANSASEPTGFFSPFCFLFSLKYFLMKMSLACHIISPTVNSQMLIMLILETNVGLSTKKHFSP